MMNDEDDVEEEGGCSLDGEQVVPLWEADHTGSWLRAGWDSRASANDWKSDEVITLCPNHHNDEGGEEDDEDDGGSLRKKALLN